ncbi:MAG: hypothetical protein LBT06_17230 [Hungatella sp.]|nr:hypothetical protein [Hungatella sp.]
MSENKEVMLVGVDIHKFVKGLCDQFLGSSPDMTDGEKMAYKLGIDNVLGLLEQTVSEAFESDILDYDNYLVHVPGLTVAEDFASVKDIIKRKKAD